MSGLDVRGRLPAAASGILLLIFATGRSGALRAAAPDFPGQVAGNYQSEGERGAGTVSIKILSSRLDRETRSMRGIGKVSGTAYKFIGLLGAGPESTVFSGSLYNVHVNRYISIELESRDATHYEGRYAIMTSQGLQLDQGTLTLSRR